MYTCILDPGGKKCAASPFTPNLACLGDVLIECTHMLFMASHAIWIMCICMMCGNPLALRYATAFPNRCLIIDSTMFWFCEYGADCQSVMKCSVCHAFIVSPIRFFALSVTIFDNPMWTRSCFVSLIFISARYRSNSLCMSRWSFIPRTYRYLVDMHMITTTSVCPPSDGLSGPSTSALIAVPGPNG